jgi:hypothetical protein
MTPTELSPVMDADGLYWGALALFGLAAVAEGLSGVTSGPGLGVWLTLLGGFIVVGAAVAAVVREEDPSAGSDWTVARVAAIAGALLYTAVTIVELV